MPNIVIHIEDATYEDIKANGLWLKPGQHFTFDELPFLKNGIVLPKGCGELIDRSVAHEQLMFGMAGTGYQTRALRIIDSDLYIPTVVKDEGNMGLEYNEYGKITDLRNLPDGTWFRVANGQWDGYVFSQEGKKYMHIDAINEDRILTGREGLVLETTWQEGPSRSL